LQALSAANHSGDILMRLIVQAIGVFLILVGVWFGFALFFAASDALREEGLLALLTFIIYCVGGIYSGTQLQQCKRRGRLAASLLLIWALFYTIYFAFFHSSADRISVPSVVVVLFVVTGLLTVLQLPGVRKICDT